VAKIPSIKRITVEDFPADQQSLVSKLAFPINSFFEEVRAAFNKSIDFNNLAQELIVLSFTTNDQSQPITQLRFKTSLSRINGIVPISLKILDNSQVVTQYPFVNFSQNSNIVTIPYISGLNATTRYEITLLVI
jgi:hypothetical protein